MSDVNIGCIVLWYDCGGLQTLMQGNVVWQFPLIYVLSIYKGACFKNLMEDFQSRVVVQFRVHGSLFLEMSIFHSLEIGRYLWDRDHHL